MSQLYAISKIYIKCNAIGCLKVKERKSIYQANITQKKVEVAILISDYVNFKERKLLGQYIFKKESINQEHITILNVYVPNIPQNI